MKLSTQSVLKKHRKIWHILSHHRRLHNLSVCCVHLPLFLLPQWSHSEEIPDTDSKYKMYPSCLKGRPLPWLANFCPEFRISGRNVRFLQEPHEFFEKLKELSENASKRITLASLYIGGGPLEHELVSSIQKGLTRSKDKLKVKILLDYTRGSRGKNNSRSLLLPLLQQYSSQVQVSLYHTPELRGLLKWLLPERWNETVGLSHLKVYIFDDTLILSGANLSDQYFTNRQDRYVVFSNCKELATFFDDLVSTVSTFSFQLEPDNSVTLHEKWDVHPYDGNYYKFVDNANKTLQHFVASRSRYFPLNDDSENCANSDQIDTLIYPLLQMYVFGITQDEQVVRRLLANAEPKSLIKLASGYFNLTNHFMDIILRSSKATYSLLVASPKVNGFFGASGFAGAIPSAYTYIAKQFFHRIMKSGEQNRILLHEYEREAWTFHVKGLWYYKPQENLPSVTLIGSPNFGYRSVYKDLEAQVAIVTCNEDLQKQLHEEQERLYQRTVPVDQGVFEKPDRSVPFWVKLVTFFIRAYF